MSLFTSYFSSEGDEANSLPGSPHQFAVSIDTCAQFKPLPSQSGSCSKLKVSVLLDSTIFVAGGNLHGRLEVESLSTLLRIGEISVILVGTEHVSDRDVGNSNKNFLTARIQFQGLHSPKSKAVKGIMDSNGLWAATRGKTIFPFAFRIPVDAPSTFNFKSSASLKYVISGVVAYQFNGRNDTMFSSRNAVVVECWESSPLPPPLPVCAIGTVKSLLGKSSDVHLSAVLEKSLYCSGSEVYIQVQVKNLSKNQIRGVKLSLRRKLLMLQSHESGGDDSLKIIDEKISEVSFRDKNHVYDSGEARTSLLNIHIPPSLRSVRNTSLAEICCSVHVSLNMGLFSKTISLELPIIVCNSASVQPPRQIDISNNIHPQKYDLINEDAEDFRQFKKCVKRGETVQMNLPANQRTVDKSQSVLASGRVLPWSEDNSGNIVQIQPYMPDTITDAKHQSKHSLNKSSAVECKEPSSYVTAKDRSVRMAPTLQSFYGGFSGDLSMALPDDMYSFTEHSVLDFSLGPQAYDPPVPKSSLSAPTRKMKRRVPSQRVVAAQTSHTNSTEDVVNITILKIAPASSHTIKNPILDNLQEEGEVEMELGIGEAESSDDRVRAYLRDHLPKELPRLPPNDDFALQLSPKMNDLIRRYSTHA